MWRTGRDAVQLGANMPTPTRTRRCERFRPIGPSAIPSGLEMLEPKILLSARLRHPDLVATADTTAQSGIAAFRSLFPATFVRILRGHRGDNFQSVTAPPGNALIKEFGGTGNNTQIANGNVGNNRILQVGGAKNNTQTASGGTGNALIVQYGGVGNNTITATDDAGHLILYQEGGQRDDTVTATGGTGNTGITVVGGKGTDTIDVTGGTGDDKIRIHGGSGQDSVTYNLTTGNDLVGVDGSKGKLDLTIQIAADAQDFLVQDKIGRVLFQNGTGTTKITITNIGQLTVLDANGNTLFQKGSP